MIAELVVRDVGLISDVRLALGSGMTALTGETGAGKTLLVEALALLAGAKADPAMVRPGADEALVEACFILGPDDLARLGDAGGIPSADEEEFGSVGGELVVARSIQVQGRSRGWIEGRMVPLGRLGEIGGALVELHGQHAHQALFSPGAQRAALDGFARVDVSPLVAARRRLAEIEASLGALGGDRSALAREADLLAYQVGELDAAGIDNVSEIEELEVLEERLAGVGALREAAYSALALLVGSDDLGVDVAGGATRLGETSARVVPDGGASEGLRAAEVVLGAHGAFDALSGRLSSLTAELDDLVQELRGLGESLEDDPQALEACQQRRRLLLDLRRKYGDTLKDVIEFREAARARLSDLAGLDERVTQLERERATVAGEVQAAESAIGATRREAAPRLANEVQSRLRDLGMGRARFEVVISAEAFGNGVSFLLGANPGEPALPLAKVASGGELARVMLALRLVLSGGPSTMVFDEVDAGIGGEAALTVGKALQDLSRSTQVIVVTHLAQVAAHADVQIKVAKTESDGRTKVEVQTLDLEGRVVELARMLSGHPDSSQARTHAEELLEASKGSTARA